MTKKKALLITLMAVSAICVFCFSGMGLASMLGVSTLVASKIIDVIDTVSTIAMIISLIGAIVGAGAVSAALVATAKKMIKKYGKKFATMW